MRTAHGPLHMHEEALENVMKTKLLGVILSDKLLSLRTDQKAPAVAILLPETRTDPSDTDCC